MQHAADEVTCHPVSAFCAADSSICHQSMSNQILASATVQDQARQLLTFQGQSVQQVLPWDRRRVRGLAVLPEAQQLSSLLLESECSGLERWIPYNPT